MTHGFDGPVYLTPEVDGASFRLTEEAVYNGSQGDSWTIPEGFTTDFASIPAAVSWAIPKLGAYSLAAIVHDLLCVGLNDYRKDREAWERRRVVEYVDHGCAWCGSGCQCGAGIETVYSDEPPPPLPTANAVDTDAIFYKIARDYGTDPLTANLLWVGVRWGALANPARRQGWLRTAPKVLGLSLLFAPVLVPTTVLALGGRLVLKAARLLFR